MAASLLDAPAAKGPAGKVGVADPAHRCLVSTHIHFLPSSTLTHTDRGQQPLCLHSHAVPWTPTVSHRDRSSMAIVTWPEGLAFSKGLRAPIATGHALPWWWRDEFLRAGGVKRDTTRAVGGPHGPTQGLPGRLGGEMCPHTHVEVLGMPSTLWFCSHVCHACSGGFEEIS